MAYPQWTVVATSSGQVTTGQVGEVTNAIEENLVKATAFPNKVLFFTTKAAATQYADGHGGAATGPLSSAASAGNAALNAGTSAVSGGWDLAFGNTKGLLTRILKVVFGGILLVAGILKLSGTDKKLEQVLPLVGGPAGKVLAA